MACLLMLVVAVVGLLQLPSVATWVVRRLAGLVPLNPGYRLEVARASGNWFGGLALQGVVLVSNGRELARVDRLTARYSIGELRGSPMHLREIDVEGVRATARRQGKTWDLAEALRKSTDTTGGEGFGVGVIEVSDAELAAQFSPDSLLRVRGLTARVRDLQVGDQVTAGVERLNLAVAPPASPVWFAVATRGEVSADFYHFDPIRIQTERTTVAGRVMLPRRFDDARLLERLDFRLEASPLALADIAPMVPSVARRGALELNARADARDNVVTAHLHAGIGKGTLALTGSTELDRGKARGLRLDGTVRRLDPSTLSSDGPAGSIDGTVRADLRGPLDSALGTADMRVTESRVGTTSLRRLDLHSDVARGRALVKLRGAADAGTLALDGWIRPFDSIPSYRFSGSATRIPGTAAVARTLAGAQSDSTLDVRFAVAGRGFAVEAADLTGRLDIAAVRQSGERLPVGRATISLGAGRLIAQPDLTVGGGRITALATAHLGDTVTYRVTNGTIAGVDLGRLLGDTLAAPLNGRFSLSGSGTTPGEVVGVADVRLDELRYGHRRVDSLAAVARLERGTAKVAMRGGIQGGRVVADLVARPFDSTASYTLNRVVADSVDLGSLMERAGPVLIHGTLKAALNGQRLTYEAAMNTNGGTIEVAGDGTPLAESPVFSVRKGRADSLDLGALLGRAGLHSDLNATFTATVAGAGDSSRTRVDLQLTPSSVNDASLTGGRLALAMERKELRGQLTLEGPDGRVGATAHGSMAKEATALHTEGTLLLEHLAKWIGRKGADGRIEGKFALDAKTDSAGLRSIGGTVDAIGGMGEARLLGAHLVLGAREGTIKVDTLEIRSNVAQLDGHGTVALRKGVPPGLLRIAGRVGDLAPLTSLIGDTVSMDSARVALNLKGPAYEWQFGGQGEAHSVVYAGTLMEKVALAASGTMDSTRLSGVRGELHVAGAALGKVSVPIFRAVARYDSVVALDADAQFGDSIHLATRLRGTVAGDTIRAALQRLDLKEGSRAWSLDRTAKLELGPRVLVDRLALTAGNRQITADGIFDLKHSSDITLGIQGLDLDAFRSAGLIPIGGQLDGKFHLSGRASDPTLQGKAGLAVIDRDGKVAGRVGANLDWKSTGLFIDAEAAPTAGGRVTIAGTLPYKLTLAPADTSEAFGVDRASVDTLGLRVRADSFNLALFQPLLPPDAATDLAGTLTANAEVAGKLDAPRAKGTIALGGLNLTLPSLGVSYQGGELSGRVEGEDLRIDRLRLTTGKKEVLDGQGVIHLRPLTDPGVELTATLDNFRVSDSPTLRSSASGKLQITGSVNRPSVTGGLNLGPTDVFVGAEAAAAKVERVELSAEDMRRLARDFGPAVLARTTETPGLMSRIRMDIELRLPRRVWIRRRKSPEADIELAGNMRLRQEPGGDMQFVGKVSPVPGRGTLDLSGRTFRLTGGEIDLNGPVDSTRLDVRAEYQVPTQGSGQDEGVVITVAAKGRLDSLALEFTSDPTMSQEDVLSYIVTGHPASDNALLEGGGQGTSGKQVAFGQLSQAISGAAGRSLGFDVFQIKQDGTSGFNLTAGRYISDRFFLNLKLPLGSGSTSTPGENLGPGFELEYAARRWLRANLRGGSLPSGISFRGRYAY